MSGVREFYFRNYFRGCFQKIILDSTGKRKMTFEIIKIETISRYKNVMIFHEYRIRWIISAEFWEIFIFRILFFGSRSNSKNCKKCEKSLFGQNMTFIGIKLLTLTLCNCQWLNSFRGQHQKWKQNRINSEWADFYRTFTKSPVIFKLNDRPLSHLPA